KLRKSPSDEMKPRIRYRLCRSLSLGVPIQCDEPPGRSKCREHCAAVSAAPERSVDINTVRLDRQAGERLVEQDRLVHHPPSQGEIFHAGRRRTVPGKRLIELR